MDLIMLLFVTDFLGKILLGASLDAGSLAVV